MKKYKTVTVTKTTTQEELDQVICNKCGVQVGFSKQKDYAEIKFSWGFYSKKDCQSHHLDVCEDCYDVFVKSFKHPVERRSFLNGGALKPFDGTNDEG